MAVSPTVPVNYALVTDRHPSDQRKRHVSTGVWVLCLCVAFLLGIQIGSSVSLSRNDFSISMVKEALFDAGLHRSSPHPKADNASSLLQNGAIDAPGTRTDSFELAFRESYGFFDDITDNDWKRYQHRARTAKNHRFQDRLKFWYSPGWWYLNNYEPIFTCPHVRRVGGVGDGPKWTCDPHRLAKQNCLVYSVGSAGKFEFENGLLELVGTSCEVHIFDPGNYWQEGMEHNNWHFHKWGLTSSYDNHYKPNVRGEFFSLQETLSKLGHEGRVIDVFKIDCESCEWFCYKDWLSLAKVDIRQLLIETHNLPYPVEATEEKHKEKWPYPPMNATDFFDAFQENNYVLFSKEVNSHPRAAGNGVEWAYLKLHPNFLHGDKPV